MDMPTTVTVLFPGGDTVVYENATIFEVAKAQLPLRFNRHPKEDPLLLIPALGKKLYFNAHSLQRYIAGGDDFEELVSNSWCDGLYRNRTKLVNQENNEIEPESLWLKRDNELIMLSGDEFYSCDFNVSEKLFYEIK
jgi:hypothetical protein